MSSAGEVVRTKKNAHANPFLGRLNLIKKKLTRVRIEFERRLTESAEDTTFTSQGKIDHTQELSNREREFVICVTVCFVECCRLGRHKIFFENNVH